MKKVYESPEAEIEKFNLGSDAVVATISGFEGGEEEEW